MKNYYAFSNFWIRHFGLMVGMGKHCPTRKIFMLLYFLGAMLLATSMTVAGVRIHQHYALQQIKAAEQSRYSSEEVSRIIRSVFRSDNPDLLDACKKLKPTRGTLAAFICAR